MKLRCLFAALSLALLTPLAYPASLLPRKFLCPVDDFEFTLPVVVNSDANSARGTDSDLCPHSAGLSSVPYFLVTCPRCNYTAMASDFNADVAPDLKPKLLSALLTSKYRGVSDSFTEIPAWERARLGFLCASLIGLQPNRLVEFPRIAVYSIRIKATAPLDLIYPLAGPVDNMGFYADMRRSFHKETDKAKYASMLVYLAMFAERNGFTVDRDNWVKLAGDNPDLPLNVRRQLDQFTALVALEPAFQDQLVQAVDQALKQTDLKSDDRANFLYLKADTLRRLGNLQQALPLYDEARVALGKLLADLQQPNPQAQQNRDLVNTVRNIRDLCDYFRTLLSPARPH